MNPTMSAVPREVEALGLRYRSAASLAAREILGEGRTPAKVKELAAITAAYSDREVAGWRAHPASPPAVACRAGCKSCCHVPVGITIPEAIRVGLAILDDWDDESLDALRARIERHQEAYRGLSGVERRKAGNPCPLLDEAGACSIHEIRPIECRGWNSLDVTRCEAFRADPWAGVEIPTDLVQITIARSIAQGTQAALVAEGLEHARVELVAGLRIVLDDPGSVDRWLSGEPAFLGAELAAVDPDVRRIEAELSGPPGG